MIYGALRIEQVYTCLVCTMPPKTAKNQRKTATATAKVGSSGKDTCCICCQKISPKDEVLFCSGICQQYLHRYCASVSLQCYQSLTSDDADPFYCFCCYKVQKEEQVTMLLGLVDSLKKDINALKAATAASGEPLPPSTTSGTKQSATVAPSQISASQNSESHSLSNSSPKLYHDRKFNVVLYGVNESSSGVSKSARLKSDLTNVVDILSTIDNSIQHQSIKDCFRLGKFAANHSHPRPILIRFIRIADVASVLSKKRLLSNPYYIKSDMTREQRLTQSLIMKERWQLIQSGVDRNCIKIKGDCLLVRNKLHGRVLNKKFILESIQSDSPLMDRVESSRNEIDDVSIVDDSHQSSDNVVTSPAFVQTTMNSSSDCSQLSTSDNALPVASTSSTSNTSQSGTQLDSGTTKS